MLQYKAKSKKRAGDNRCLDLYNSTNINCNKRIANGKKQSSERKNKLKNWQKKLYKADLMCYERRNKEVNALI